MTKYGWEDHTWTAELEKCYPHTKFMTEIEKFNVYCFIPAMKRKTVTEGDKKALEHLINMVEILKEKLEG